jgi:hypothetical protein
MPITSHDPCWVEDNSRSTSVIVYFRCTMCGRSTSVDRKNYEKGTAFPSMSPHYS